MDRRGGNGGSGSGHIQNGQQGQQVNNGGSVHVAGAQEQGPREALLDGNLNAAAQSGSAHPPVPVPEVISNLVSHGDGNPSFRSPYNPQSGQNTPGSDPWSMSTPGQLNRVDNPFTGFSMGIDPSKIIERAKRAMVELEKLATMGEPMWQRNGEIETLNGLQYLKEFGCAEATMEDIMRLVEVGPSLNSHESYFPRDIPTKLTLTLESEPLHVEASRDVGSVKMSPTNIVALFMDWNQWRIAFPSIVSKATIHGVVLGSFDGSYNGVIQVMTAEFHQSTPLIPTRQSYFARYCKMIAHGKWGMVDVFLENLLPYPQSQFRRRPSGCLIEQMHHIANYSKVTWVEHVEADHSSLHPLFSLIIDSGFAFGARRWIAALNRHCQWLASSVAIITPSYSGALILKPARDSVLRLVESMRRIYFKNVSSCTQNSWMRMPSNFYSNPGSVDDPVHAEDVRVRFGSVINLPGRSPSNTIIFTTSIRVPVQLKILFEFLHDVRYRLKWDMFSWGRVITEAGYVKTGDNPKNRVSVIQVNASATATKMMYLQESYYNEAGSYVIYEPLDKYDMTYILNGGNPDIPAFLPSGFTILPEMPPGGQDEPKGCILTIAFQVDSSSNDEFIPPATFTTIHAFLGKTIGAIRDVFH